MKSSILNWFRLGLFFSLSGLNALAVFNERGIRNFSVLSSHGHEWLNWRRYLYQTAQIMFQEER